MSVVFRDRATFACQDMYPHFPEGSSRWSGAKESSFSAISRLAGPRVSQVVDFAVGIKCFGVATSYLIVVGDMMPTACAQMGCSDGVFNGRRIWVLLGFLCATPFSFSHSLDILKVQYCY